METNAFTQRFTLRNANQKTGLAKLYHEIKLNDQRFFLPVARIQKSLWNKHQQVLKGEGAEISHINLQIANRRERATKIIVECELKQRLMSERSFRLAYEDRSPSHDFHKWLEKDMEDRYGLVENGTYAMLRVTMKKLREFRPKLFTHEINLQLIEQWDTYLQKKGFHQNYLWRQHTNFKSFIHRANRLSDLGIDNPYDKFKIKKIATDPMYLNRKDLKALDQLYFSKELPKDLQSTLQIYLFGCFTGPRVSDLRRISEQNITDGYLHYVQKKTSNTSLKEVIVALSKYSLRYLNEEGHVFTRMYADQKMNEHLKVISKRAGLNKELSMHSARHTFGFLLASAGVPAIKIKELMGHQNLSTTERYIHLSNSYRRRSIEKMDQFIDEILIDPLPGSSSSQLRVV